ncbi:hypothetical protein [Denitrobaculum tricleocarpae]|uniref:Uncharacterized protein n=1 Tax=Denitrobaculum tricleocarpae TaxID=2591009 RepID=A0A545TUG5_9PROT|nr:hypothetical protein [Denitrobaculum tricleocarpae]TQV80858.1 hypothetical protein FKG95_11970 [Denitrobaculum tricleocarpae]
MSDGDETDGLDEAGEDREGVVFARIIRGVADHFSKLNVDEGPQDIEQMLRVFSELADAFDTTNGFEFDREQALPLSYAFTMLEAGMRVMSEQATEGGYFNAAAKMEWAAIQAKGMIGELERRHQSNEGGVITFDDADEMIEEDFFDLDGEGMTKH